MKRVIAGVGTLVAVLLLAPVLLAGLAIAFVGLGLLVVSAYVLSRTRLGPLGLDLLWAGLRGLPAALHAESVAAGASPVANAAGRTAGGSQLPRSRGTHAQQLEPRRAPAAASAAHPRLDRPGSAAAAPGSGGLSDRRRIM